MSLNRMSKWLVESLLTSSLAERKIIFDNYFPMIPKFLVKCTLYINGTFLFRASFMNLRERGQHFRIKKKMKVRGVASSLDLLPNDERHLKILQNMRRFPSALKIAKKRRVPKRGVRRKCEPPVTAPAHKAASQIRVRRRVMSRGGTIGAGPAYRVRAQAW